MMKTSKTIQIVKKTITDNKLISAGDRVLVALSGGADSVFLLYVLKELTEELGFTVAACHVEHGIRGNSSVEDMHFSREMCSEKGIEFFSKRFDVPSVAAAEKISVEAAGRKVRYEYFSALMKEKGFSKTATAHHRDDKTETIVMNILRGCGLRGFAGIEYENGSVIRPLLDVTKAEIVQFLQEHNIPYRTDETNFDIEYTRNRVRRCLLPTLRSYNPSFDDNIVRQSNIFVAEDNYLNSVAANALKNCSVAGGIDIEIFRTLHTALKRRVMYKYLASCKETSNNISYTDVEAAVDLCASNKTGARYSLSDGITVGVDYGVFSVKQENKTLPFEYDIQFDVPVVIKELGVKVTLHKTGGNLLIKDTDKVTIRSRKNGDSFFPTGMEGRKKLKDYLSDKKISRDNRDKIPVLTINGEIASVIGLRNDRRYYNSGGTCRLHTETI